MGGTDAVAPCSLRWLVRIGEVKLVTVEIFDHEQPVAPVTILDWNAPGFELGPKSVERRDLGDARLPSRST